MGFISRVLSNPIKSHHHSPVGGVSQSGLLWSLQFCKRLLRGLSFDNAPTFQTDFDVGLRFSY